MKRKRLLAAVMAAVMASTLTMSVPVTGYAMDQRTETVASEPEEGNSSDAAVTNPEQSSDSVAEEPLADESGSSAAEADASSESEDRAESTVAEDSQVPQADSAPEETGEDSGADEKAAGRENVPSAHSDTGGGETGAGAIVKGDSVSNAFYTYTPSDNGYQVSLSSDFTSALSNSNSYTGPDAEGKTITWNVGDPLPNPDPNGKYNNIPVVDMGRMFYDCGFLTSLDLSSFDTSNVTEMSHMFDGCISLRSLNLNSFNTSNVTNMSYMFHDCEDLTSLDLSNFDTSKVTDMSYMFNMGDIYFSGNLTSLDLSSFDTSNVTNMSNMFNECLHLTSLDLSRFDTSNVTDMSHMFNDCRLLTSLDLSRFDTSNVTDMSYMFNECENLTSLDLSSFDTSNVTDMNWMFHWCFHLTSLDLSSFDTSNVTDMDSMFEGCGSLTSLDLSSFDTSNVTNMSSMFNGLSLTSLDLSGFDTSNVTNMSSMFNGLSLTSLDLSSFDTSNVTDMYWMFYGCLHLTSLDLSSFDTSNVTDMDSMFYGCSGLTSLDLSSFDTSNVTNMSNMFNVCDSLTSLDLSSFDTSNVTNMRGMFYGCLHLTSLDLSSFDTSNVTDMSFMFYCCSGLTSLDLSSFDTSNVTDMSDMFNETSMWVQNKPAIGYVKDQTIADELNKHSDQNDLRFIYDPHHTSGDKNIDFNGSITFPDSTVVMDENTKECTVRSNIVLTLGRTNRQLNTFLTSLTWKSTDESVAKITGTKMSGSAADPHVEITLETLKPGEVEITGENSNGFKTTAKVKVEPKVVIEKVPEFLGGSNNVTYSVTLPSGNKEYLEQFINGIDLNSNKNIQVTREKVSYAEDKKSVVVTLKETALRKGKGSIKLTTSGKKDYTSNDFTFVPEYYSYLQYTGNSSNDTYGITYSEKKYNPDKLPFEFVLEFHPGKLDQETTAKVKNIDVSVSGIPFQIISDKAPDIELKANEKYTYKFSVNKKNMAGAPSEVDSTAVITAKSGDKFGTVTREISVHNYDLESKIAKEVEKNNQKKLDEAKNIKSSIAKSKNKALKNTAKEYLQNIDKKYTLNAEYKDIFSDTELTIIKFVIAQQVATYNISEKKAQDAVKSSLEYKLDKKVLGYLEKYTGSLSTYNTAEGKNIPIAFYMNTEKYGKVKCEFEYNSTAFSLSGHQYGETGTINGEITILKNGNVKNISGSIVNATDCDGFSQGVSEIAASSLSDCVKKWNKYFKSGDEVLGDGSKIFSVMSYGLFVAPLSVEMAELGNELGGNSAKIFKKAGVKLLKDEYKSIVGLCPVNIYVYDSDNDLVGSIENNAVSKIPEDGVYLETIGDDHDGKQAMLFHKDYRFAYKATDNGKLNVKIYEMANWADVLRVSEIHDIPLVKNNEYEQEINNKVFTDPNSYAIKSGEKNYPVDNVADLMDDSIDDDWDAYLTPENKSSCMYRLYNPNSGEHFYTSNQGERDHLVSVGWRYEGIAWNAPLTGAPIYRLYNPNAGDHHYTGSTKERDNLVKLGWRYEGVAWYTASSASHKPQYRLYNPNCTGAGAHHYTGSTEERDGLVKLGWRYEGIAWYGV